MADQKETSAEVGPADRVAIGISIGNSNSSIAFTIDDKAEVIANEDGDRQIPTILSYVEGEEYYGNQAKNFLVRNPNNTVSFFREFIGKEFKSIDPTHCHASAHPHETEGVVTFSVKEKAEEDAEPATLSVSEVTTRYIRRLVTSASEYIGKKVTSAVVTVPTNFNEKQKTALIKAAKDADLEILQLISDPAAAILAYDARPEAVISDKMIVVADLGGTRSDVSVVASRGGMYTVLATAHDFEFAGVHLDQVLMDHFAKEFQKKHTSAADPRSNPKSLAKLRLESEATKKALSLGTNATFSIESLSDGFDFALTVNRTRFEMLGRKVFDGFNRLIEGVIKKAELDVLDIDEIILAGGTSNIPRIAANMANIFPEATTIVSPSTNPKAINPSELQVRGAALQASLIYQYEAEDIEQSCHPAVTTVQHITNAIGVVTTNESGDEIFIPIVPPETAVPARRILQMPVPANGGDILIKIAEGGTHIKVTKPDAKPEKEKKEGEEDEDEDESEEEEEDKREKVWKIGNVLAEAAVRGTKKGAMVEVTINVLADLSVAITARELGAKGGVRGTVPGSS